MRLRIATANLENLDDDALDKPPLAERAPVLRSALVRLRADVLCLQEIHSQDAADGSRELRALEQVIAGTDYDGFERLSTRPQAAAFYEVRNLVILSRFPIAASRQLSQDLVPGPQYRPATAQPAPARCWTNSIPRWSGTRRCTR
jgi:hypothetical protein